MELLQAISFFLLCSLKQICSAYIGINFNENREMKDEELHRSLVPMIRLPRDNSMFLRPTTSSFFNPIDYDDKQQIQYNDNGLRPENEIKPIVSPGKKLSEMLKMQREYGNGNMLQDVEGDSAKLVGNGMIAFRAGTDMGHKKEFKLPEQGNCYIDGNSIMNSEEIYQNDCGTLQCMNSEVTWSLKPLARSLPHCEGTKSIPSMYTSYAKVKIIDDDDDVQQNTLNGQKSSLSKLDVDVVDQRKKIEEASKKMVEAENWD